jgi:hypothetical protein
MIGLEEEAFKAYIYSWTKRIVPNVTTHCLLSWATRERNERTGQKRKGVGGIAHQRLIMLHAIGGY